MSSTQRYRRTPSFSSSTTSSLAKKRVPATASASATEIPAKGSSSATSGKKRVPLGNITNQSNGARASSLVPSANKIAKIKKAQPTNTASVGNALLPSSLNVKPSSLVLPKITPLPRANDVYASNILLPQHCSINLSPCESNDASVSMDETMSTCDSFKSPEVEYLDNSDDPVIDSIERKTFSNLHISDHAEPDAGSICDRDVLADMDIDDKVVNLDSNYNDPQLCATFACDIYKHLRASEAKKRPSTNFMEKVQTDINPSMRGILVDWLIEVSEEYRLVPDTLFLTVNYIDRYLSGNVMNRQRLQLLGVACMMIAAKYEEICAPQVEEFCYITDNTYFKEEVLDMESAVLNYLKFEMTAPTAKCFLRRFVRAAQGINEVPSMQLECMGNYITELSLLEYNMLRYTPSLLAASAIFLAKFILLPSKRPWNSTLQHYTQYKPSDLIECVNDLHQLCFNSQSSSLPAVREKYSQHKYKCVSKNHCPVLIPSEFFHN